LKLVEFVKKVYTTTEKPIVGICFGHQIIGRALGAKVAVSPGGWEVCVDRISLNETGQKLLGVSSLVSTTDPSLEASLIISRVFIKCIEMQS
jgi:GMP synthase-like glutamine amidotransferase